MKTLTITDAKKNLGVWLKAAARGEDVAIISGADVIALRKVEVGAVESSYAAAEYGATPAELERFEAAVDRRFVQASAAGRLRSLEQVEKAFEKTAARRKRRL